MREERRLKLRARRRRWRVRQKAVGTAERPRLTVYRSGRHIYCQLVDDAGGRTLAAASTISPEIREDVKDCSWNAKGAEKVGELIAKRAGAARACPPSPQAASRQPQAASRQPQAASRKPQAASRKPLRVPKAPGGEIPRPGRPPPPSRSRSPR